MRVIGYVRVSKREQVESGLGLDDQRRRIADECETRGWDLAGIEADEGVSGGSMMKRLSLRRALHQLARGEADVLMVVKLDRLSRSMSDYVEVVRLSKEGDWALVSLDLAVDMTTPQGELVALIMAAFAQFERRLISERTKSALGEARRRGTVLGRPTDTDPAVEARVLAERAGGASYGAIARGLEEDGLPTPRGGQKWYGASVKAIYDRLTRKDPE